MNVFVQGCVPLSGNYHHKFIMSTATLANVSIRGLIMSLLLSKLLLLLIWAPSTTYLFLSAHFYCSPQHQANRHCPSFFWAQGSCLHKIKLKTNVSVLTLFSVKLQLRVLMWRRTFLAYVVIIQSRCYRFYPILWPWDAQHLLEGRRQWHLCSRNNPQTRSRVKLKHLQDTDEEVCYTVV